MKHVFRSDPNDFLNSTVVLATLPEAMATATDCMDADADHIYVCTPNFIVRVSRDGTGLESFNIPDGLSIALMTPFTHDFSLFPVRGWVHVAEHRLVDSTLSSAEPHLPRLGCRRGDSPSRPLPAD